MTLKDLAKTSFGNLGRHKVRTALSAVGVTVGILTIVTMLSLGVGVQREIVRVFKSAGLETIRIHPATEERTAFNQFAEPRRTVLITTDLVEEIRARDDEDGDCADPPAYLAIDMTLEAWGGASGGSALLSLDVPLLDDQLAPMEVHVGTGQGS